MKNFPNLTTIDFNQPWWRIIVQQKLYLSLTVLCVLVRDIFWTLEPFLVAVVLEHSSWYFFAGACVAWAFAELNLMVMPHFNAQFQLQIIHSVFYSAHHHLLTIDPQFHVKRSSGVVLAKIERAARGYEEVLDQITFSFAPLIIGISTMLIILGRYSLWLAGGVFACLAAMVLYAYYFARYACQAWEKDFIHSDDEFKDAAFENLAQVHLVRATFATRYMRDKLTQKTIKNAGVERNLWMAYSFVSRVLNFLYSLSILGLVAFFITRVQQGAPLAHAIGIVLAYIQCTNQLIKILQPFRKYMRGMTAIKDLFAFMHEFGKQTIPVFEEQPSTVEKHRNTVIEVRNLVFGYGEAQLFNGHSLSLVCPSQQSNKLYGIIGPSGVGKTTLFSLLGGQLKPLSGSVIINGIDIYAVGDDTRCQLIALQGQIATSVKGTVRYNLLFGLPEHHGYTDQFLLEVLRKVGLEAIFNEHHGLDTLLGEGALNISGGQRQRLNFAGLYIRALYYKPVMILIDEPTSSLDEISEAAVTSMIVELASHSVTFVIAHRLKTLEDAVGLIDLSLVSEDKNIAIYSSQELKKHSHYYRQLVDGALEIVE